MELMKEMNEKQQGASMEDMAAANKSANDSKSPHSVKITDSMNLLSLYLLPKYVLVMLFSSVG